MKLHRLDKQGPKLFRLEGIAVVNPADAPADTGPKWNQLFVSGKRYRPDFDGGFIDFDDEFFATMLANFERMKALSAEVKLPIDYGHDEAGIAAGWILDLQIRDGVPFALIDWNDRARAAIAAKELQCLSPTFSTDGWDPTRGCSQGPTLYGAALLNTPFLFDLPVVAAGRSATTPTNEPAPEADPQEKPMKKLLLSLGLTEDTKEEVAVEAVKALQEKAAQDVEKRVELSAAPLRVELSAAKAEVTRLTAEVAKLNGDKFEGEVKALCDSLVTAKKIIPASRDSVVEYAKALGLEKAKAFFSNLPGTVVPAGEQGVKGEETAPEGAEAAAEWQVKLSELEAKGNTPDKAFRLAQRLHPALFKAALKVKVANPAA